MRAVKLIQTWQLSDKYSWYRDAGVVRQMNPARPLRPLLFDAAMREKPAAQALREALRQR